MFDWYYKLFKLKIVYKIDTNAMIVRVYVNKPESKLTQEEIQTTNGVCDHFRQMKYGVIMEYS